MITNAQYHLLNALDNQLSKAMDYPMAYSCHLSVGRLGCHAATAEALIKRDLVVVYDHPLFGRSVIINDNGSAAVAEYRRNAMH